MVAWQMRKEAPVPSKGGAVKKTDKKPNIFKRIRMVRDMKSELKKFFWPHRQILNNTIVALS
jgi:preprotein translocase subunit SecE